MERKEYITSLFNKYLSGQHSKQELDELLSYFELDQDKEALGDLIKLEIEKSNPTEQEQEIVEVIASRIEFNLFGGKRSNSGFRTLLPWLSAAAIFVLALGFTFYFYIIPAEKHQNIKNSIIVSDIGPGGSKAILILSDGTKIELNKVKNKQLINEPGTIINKVTEGQIVYTGNASSPNTANSFNTIQTPNGGEFHLVLPDGTEVWLNAASTLKFPTSFAKAKERRVELSGEAYFRVAHNKSKPFRVSSQGQIVEVLGTSFNVMAYKEERSMNTTLLEGSVKVTKGTNVKIIKPGQQAVANTNIKVIDADVDLALAWKNGRTYFKDADIQTLMRSLSRWYDLEIEYRGPIPKRLFTGGISRKSNLSGILKILELANIHTTLEGRKLIVKP